MEQIERIQRTLDYIEENLRTELCLRELADLAGYSQYHYGRLFREATGMSVGHYILRRRLLHAGYDLARGGSGIETALDYGFGTYAGFYRAFVREFGCTPSEYQRSNRGKKPWRIDLTKEEGIIMTHKEAARVLKHWGLEGERLTDILVETTGAQRDHVTAVGDKYILKRTADLKRLHNSLHLARELTALGLLAPVPVPTASGGEYLTEGEYLYTLTERLPGAP